MGEGSVAHDHPNTYFGAVKLVPERGAVSHASPARVSRPKVTLSVRGYSAGTLVPHSNVTLHVDVGASLPGTADLAGFRASQVVQAALSQSAYCPWCSAINLSKVGFPCRRAKLLSRAIFPGLVNPSLNASRRYSIARLINPACAQPLAL